jgi:hypothetical protein
MASAPITGDWQQGDVVFRSNASATKMQESNAYWICTTSGSFGTVAAKGDITAGTKIVSKLNNIANINVGGFITIADAGITNSQVTYVDSSNNTVTVANNATASVTAAAISASPPVFVAKDYQNVKGTTAARPALTRLDAGYMYFDTTLAGAGKPIWWSGTAWVDAAGAVV